VEPAKIETVAAPFPEEKPVEAAATESAPAVVTEAPPLPPVREEDISVPPASDLDTEAFFSARPRHEEPVIEVDNRDPRLAQKMTAHAARRRAHLSRYVKIAVGVASALCLAALVKGAVARGNPPGTDHRHAELAQAAAVAPVTTAQEKQAAPSPPDTAQAPDPQASPPTGVNAQPPQDIPPPPDTAPPAADTTPPPADTTPPADTAAPANTGTVDPAVADTTPDPKEAAKAKIAARNALERGKVADSIEQGERSVSLDPTDGEAWLILGAAYQEKGDMKNARRSYKACLDQGKRGPKYECAAMPH
jgi:hypothetical protein